MRDAYKPLVIPGKPIILSGSVRYGVSRNCEAQKPDGTPIKIALVIIERDNGAFETLAIPEDKIRFAGEGTIEAEVRKATGL